VDVSATLKRDTPMANHFFCSENGQKSVLAAYEQETKVLRRVIKRWHLMWPKKCRASFCY